MQIEFSKREVLLLSVLVFFGTMMHFFGSRDSLDARFYYSVSEAKSFLMNLSEAEARAYLRNALFDIGFLATYSMLFFCMFRDMCRSCQRVSLVFLFPGTFDFIETLTIIALLTNFTDEPPLWLGITTCLKWVTGALLSIGIVCRYLKQRCPT